MKDVPYKNSMLTGRMLMRLPGIFAPRVIATPSLGCIVRMIWLGRTPKDPSCRNATCGTGLSVMAISVSLRPSRLPVRR